MAFLQSLGAPGRVKLAVVGAARSLAVLVGQSSEKILDLMFGWAVRALFGQTTWRDRVHLEALTASAAVWPLLLLGVASPRAAGLLLPFVPVPHGASAVTARLVWLVLALAAPLAVGVAIAAGGRLSTSAPEPRWKGALRGFPLMVALAGAFVLTLVSVPVMRIAAFFRRDRSGSVALATDAVSYHPVVDTVVAALNRHGFGLRPVAPRWWVAAPLRLLERLAADAFRMFIPQTLEHYAAPDLQISFYTNGALVSGSRRKVSWAQGVIQEAVTHSDALQTQAPAAQTLERLIRRVWMVHDEIADNPPNRGRLLQTVDRIARRLAGLDIDFDDWQVLYRQLIQLERAVRGQRQILEENSAFARIGAAEASYRGTSWSDTRPTILMDAIAEVTQVQAPAQVEAEAEAQAQEG